MNLKIIQWNIHGLINNFHELQLIIKDINPDIISLQETLIPYNHQNIIYPKNYNGFFHNLSNNTTAKQGVAILIKKSIPHKLLYLNPIIASIAIQINIGIEFIIVSSNISPQQNFTNNSLKSLIKNINTPLLITGDFNSWSTLWGSTVSNTRGKIIENFILNEDLIILNNGSPTHFSTHNTFTNIDISMCSPQLAPFCSWKTLRNLHGSDHFPISIEIEKHLTHTKIKPNPKFKTDSADWFLYMKKCDEFISQAKMSHNINQQAALLVRCIRSAANISIPQTNNKSNRQRVVWWNSKLEFLRTQKQSLWHIFKRFGTGINEIQSTTFICNCCQNSVVCRSLLQLKFL